MNIKLIKKNNKEKIKITPLGGVEEIAKNMYLIEINDEMFLLDAGLMFPEVEMIGIDAVIPDITYIVKNKEKLKGIFLSNGHVSSMGAIPYIVDKINCPIFGSKLALEILKNNLRQLGIKKRLKFNYVNSKSAYKFNNTTVSFFKTTYSMPDSLGITLTTSQGNIVYTGEFKFDQSVSREYKADMFEIAKLGQSGVLALLSDSSNANTAGHNIPEQEAAEQIDSALSQANKRLIVTCYASNFLTMTHIVNSALNQGRKILLLGEAINNSIKTARKLGYMKIEDEKFIKTDELQNYPKNEILILSSGEQGEPIEAIKNITEKKVEGIKIEQDDTVMVAATPSPTMEVMLYETLNLLVQLGANVVASSKRLHASSHATKEELKLMLNMLNPKYFIPVQGEYRNLKKHAELAVETGVARENVYLLEKGSTLEILGQKTQVLKNNVPVGNVLVDGKSVGDVEAGVLKDRKVLANEGIFVASYAISRKTKELLGKPCIQTNGFVYVKKSAELIKEAEERVSEYIENNPIRSLRECSLIKAEIRSMLSSLLYDNTKRRPIIVVNFTIV
ncbi:MULTISPECIES: ribonuclease J [unclassified Gemella]|uniref:ribonuclease J n=1 Tax=unclassified Gemella TaxID=2624949 RepID=UPI001C057321|nr:MULTISPECIES: ribonuclease J [unclassified Gemella]MBU0279052.1 ribonuclease J [Gemella sp. zg-1178]QWQ38781.1 ribonuclease J [Gemella sp. zg-570]